MSKKTSDVYKLEDLINLDLPKLNKIQSKILLNEVSFILSKSIG